MNESESKCFCYYFMEMWKGDGRKGCLHKFSMINLESLCLKEQYLVQILESHLIPTSYNYHLSFPTYNYFYLVIGLRFRAELECQWGAVQGYTWLKSGDVVLNIAMAAGNGSPLIPSFSSAIFPLIPSRCDQSRFLLIRSQWQASSTGLYKIESNLF